LGAPATPAVRLGYLDWLRGLAVLIMIEAHVLDAWTRPEARQSLRFGWAMIVGGFGAPIFLFLAGVGVVLAARSRERRLGDVRAAARSVATRGWQIFGLAFLFRLQSYLLSGGASLIGLLKVDILNVMGPAMVAAAAIWGFSRRDGLRLAAFALATLAISLMTPSMRLFEWVRWLPDPIEWYLRPVAGRTNFTLFPWAGFVTAGALVGVLIAAADNVKRERRLMAGLLAGGLALAFVSYRLSFLPQVFAGSSFWTSSPTFFFLRVGLLVSAIPAAWFWSSRIARAGSWRPMEIFGRSSLFVYWVHVEMVYGGFSRPLHRSLSFEGALAAFALFTLALFGLVCLKDSLKRRLHAPR
jgi:uncharacterized membrane protein